MFYESHTFFRPPELKRERSTIRADLYNRCRLLLGRSARDCAFIPIRAMQFLGVITREEVIFVDSQAYGVHQGEGGRMILLAWQVVDSPKRDSLTEPVAIDVVHYHPNQDDTQRRLIGSFFQSMDQLVERQQAGMPEQHAKVVSLVRKDA